MWLFVYTAYANACLTVNFAKILKVHRISIVSRTPFFRCEVSCKKVRLIIRAIWYVYLGMVFLEESN